MGASTERSSDASRRTGSAPRDNWAAVLIASAAVTVVTLDLYGVNVALPTIRSDLDTGPTVASAIIVGYSLSLTALLIPFGRLADRAGRRRLLVSGLLAFGAVSVASGLAPNGPMLVGLRVVQGAAAAAVAATSLSVVSLAVRPDRRALALSLWTAVTAAGSTLGPPLAGLATSAWSWRWFLGLNGPLAVICAVAVMARVAESQSTAALAPDRRGTATFVIGLVVLVTGVTALSAPQWPLALAVGGVLAGALVLAQFVRIERNVEDPLIDLRFFADRAYTAVAAVAFAANWAYGVLILYVPVALQDQLGTSAFEAGIMLLAFTILYAVWSPAVGVLQRRLRSDVLVGVGLFLAALGLFQLTFADRSSLDRVAIGLVPPGAGLTGVGAARARPGPGLQHHGNAGHGQGRRR